MNKYFRKIKLCISLTVVVAMFIIACGRGQPTIPVLTEEEIAAIEDDVAKKQVELDAQLEQVLGMSVQELEQSATQKEEPARVKHKVFPKEPGEPEQTLEDSFSYPSADEHRAVSGDNYAENLLERPFTPGEMVFQPWLDIQKVDLFSDPTFFYFTIEVYGVDEESGILRGAYGVEIDTDKDGRGDYLIWAFFPNIKRWNILRVLALEDKNDNVGGPSPMNSDAPWDKGDGYETRLFLGGKFGEDQDAAWVRVSPKDSTLIQIAIKRELIGNSDSFLWSVWADNGLKAPGIMDYNDVIQQAEAGSPISTDEDYPVKLVRSVDNTCRKAYNFTADASIPGVCIGVEAREEEPSVGRTPDDPTHGDEIHVVPND